jgi:hypothetical protein
MTVRDQYARLSPADAVVALRSFPRRYRQVMLPASEGELREAAEEHLRRVGPDGVSALDIADDAVRALMALGRALDEVLTRDRPALLAEVLDPARRSWNGPGVEDTDDLLALLGAECTALADRAEHVPADDWKRPATVTGGGVEVAALDVLHEAVRTGAESLRRVERAVAAVS